MVVEETEEMGMLQSIFTSPLNLGLLAVCLYLLYKILKPNNDDPGPPPEPQLPTLKKQDMTVAELKEYDGIKNEGRILIAVNGKVFDVTRGKRFYGPEGPYGIFAGRDASRGLATFRLDKDAIKDEYDDISDLNSMEMESVQEWEMQFSEKYDFIGKLLKPGEEPTDYSDLSESEADKEKNKDD
ncbi:membrane-associated progesterone receptor component 1-like [Clavelina lepadiformis]|uniref:Cytochrome b5 heme-binding domain-containing protein n=1 Tax=Clavelina lepadiformis TaxID=159417 RepID=A0ABP0G3A4_CLALP